MPLTNPTVLLRFLVRTGLLRVSQASLRRPAALRPRAGKARVSDGSALRASCSTRVARREFRRAGCSAQVALPKPLRASCSAQVALRKLLCASCSAGAALRKLLCASCSVRAALRKLLCLSRSAQVALRESRFSTRRAGYWRSPRETWLPEKSNMRSPARFSRKR